MFGESYFSCCILPGSVPPKVSSWLERKDNKVVAVCKAEKGKPAANISWTHWGNSSSLETRHDSHGFFAVESRLELAEGMDAENLRCLIRHQYWDEAEILVPEPLKGQTYAEWIAQEKEFKVWVP